MKVFEKCSIRTWFMQKKLCLYLPIIAIVDLTNPQDLKI